MVKFPLHPEISRQKYVCEFCFREFDTEEELRKHMESHYKIVEFKEVCLS
jgi:hypothetical protein